MYLLHPCLPPLCVAHSRASPTHSRPLALHAFASLRNVCIRVISSIRIRIISSIRIRVLILHTHSRPETCAFALLRIRVHCIYTSVFSPLYAFAFSTPSSTRIRVSTISIALWARCMRISLWVATFALLSAFSLAHAHAFLP